MVLRPQGHRTEGDVTGVISQKAVSGQLRGHRCGKIESSFVRVGDDPPAGAGKRYAVREDLSSTVDISPSGALRQVPIMPRLPNLDICQSPPEDETLRSRGSNVVVLSSD